MVHFKTHLLAVAVMALSTLPTHSAVVVNLQEQGTNVVLTVAGSVNLSGLTFLGSINSTGGYIAPTWPSFQVGPDFSPKDQYRIDGITGPTSFGSSGWQWAPITSGSVFAFGFVHNWRIDVPTGYTSGSLLSPGSAAISNATFASLGIHPGTYTWSWGSGATADSLTLNIGNVAAVPEPSAYALALAGAALMGFMGRRKLVSGRGLLFSRPR